MEGSIIEHYQAKYETLNIEGYCVLLNDEMKPADAKRMTVSYRNSPAQQCPSECG
jgi:hypothetical protein